MFGRIAGPSSAAARPTPYSSTTFADFSGTGRSRKEGT
jgi:hypothetical protein